MRVVSASRKGVLLNMDSPVARAFMKKHVLVDVENPMEKMKAELANLNSIARKGGSTTELQESLSWLDYWMSKTEAITSPGGRAFARKTEKILLTMKLEKEGWVFNENRLRSVLEDLLGKWGWNIGALHKELMATQREEVQKGLIAYHLSHILSIPGGDLKKIMRTRDKTLAGKVKKLVKTELMRQGWDPGH